MGIRSKSGKLFLDFRWKSQRCREFTGLEDTRENRRRAEAFYSVIQGEIALGTFDYRKHFPNGARLADFYPHDVIAQRGQIPLVGDYLDDWHPPPPGYGGQASGARPSCPTGRLPTAPTCIRRRGCTTSRLSAAT